MGNETETKDLILEEDLEHDPGLGEEIDLSGIIFPPTDIRSTFSNSHQFLSIFLFYFVTLSPQSRLTSP
jgi:hypothetical protein